MSVNFSHVCIIYVKIYEKMSSGGLEVSLSIVIFLRFTEGFHAEIRCNFNAFHTSVKRRKIISNSYNYNFFRSSSLLSIYNNYVFLKAMFKLITFRAFRL